MYHQYFKYVYNFCRRRVNTSEDAEDIVAEVFHAVWSGLGKIEDQNTLKPWIFGITRNKLNDFLRKRYRLTEFEVPTVDYLHDSFSDPNYKEFGDTADDDKRNSRESSKYDNALHKPVLNQLIESLPEVDQKIVRLRYGSRLSFQDIADELGMTEGNAKVRHHRLLKKLYEEWKSKI